MNTVEKDIVAVEVRIGAVQFRVALSAGDYRKLEDVWMLAGEDVLITTKSRSSTRTRIVLRGRDGAVVTTGPGGDASLALGTVTTMDEERGARLSALTRSAV